MSYVQSFSNCSTLSGKVCHFYQDHSYINCSIHVNKKHNRSEFKVTNDQNTQETVCYTFFSYILLITHSLNIQSCLVLLDFLYKPIKTLKKNLNELSISHCVVLSISPKNANFDPCSYHFLQLSPYSLLFKTKDMLSQNEPLLSFVLLHNSCQLVQ